MQTIHSLTYLHVFISVLCGLKIGLETLIETWINISPVCTFATSKLVPFWKSSQHAMCRSTFLTQCRNGWKDRKTGDSANIHAIQKVGLCRGGCQYGTPLCSISRNLAEALKQQPQGAQILPRSHMYLYIHTCICIYIYTYISKNEVYKNLRSKDVFQRILEVIF